MPDVSLAKDKGTSQVKQARKHQAAKGMRLMPWPLLDGRGDSQRLEANPKRYDPTQQAD